MGQKLPARELERVEAEIEWRARRQREELGPRYDFFGDECGCLGRPGPVGDLPGLCERHPTGEGCDCYRSLGECPEHPRGRPDQRPPGSHRASEDRADWNVWLIEGGRGSGKTRPAAEWIVSEAMAYPGIWIALISETVKDVRDVMIEHPRSGLLAVSPPWFKAMYYPSLARVEWPNGSFATIYSAEAPDALRGPEFERAWADEYAKWSFGQREVLDNLRMCLRGVGRPGMPPPRAVFSTTPKPGACYKELREDRGTIRTGAPTARNRANLNKAFVGDVYGKYAGTRIGRQELDAELLEDTPGALWTWKSIDDYRVRSIPEFVALIKCGVGADPNVGSANPDSADEAGLIVGALGSDGHGYILCDGSTKGGPKTWSGRAAQLWEQWMADRIIGEVNNGGEMVEMVIHHHNPTIPFTAVHASRGKQTRAEPAAMLYEQGKIHHVGTFPELEQQLTTWVPGERSPDRMDALVWLLTYLFPNAAGGASAIAGGERERHSGSSPSSRAARMKVAGSPSSRAGGNMRRRLVSVFNPFSW